MDLTAIFMYVLQKTFPGHYARMALIHLTCLFVDFAQVLFRSPLFWLDRSKSLATKFQIYYERAFDYSIGWYFALFKMGSTLNWCVFVNGFHHVFWFLIEHDTILVCALSLYIWAFTSSSTSAETSRLLWVVVWIIFRSTLVFTARFFASVYMRTKFLWLKLNGLRLMFRYFPAEVMLAVPAFFYNSCILAVVFYFCNNFWFLSLKYWLLWWFYRYLARASMSLPSSASQLNRSKDLLLVFLVRWVCRRS